MTTETTPPVGGRRGERVPTDPRSAASTRHARWPWGTLAFERELHAPGTDDQMHKVDMALALEGLINEAGCGGG